MRRWNFWYLVSGIMQLTCCACILLEWFRYSDTRNSAPFSLTVWVNAAVFGIPAAVCFLFGLYLEKKRKDDSHEKRN